MRPEHDSITELPWLSRRAHRWFERRTWRAHDLPRLAELARRKSASGVRVSVALPTLNEGETIEDICVAIRANLMGRTGLVDELLVVDSASSDATVSAARRGGANVVQLAELMPDVAPVRGKGEALWRSLSEVSGDIVVWIDADIRNFSPHFVARLLAPLVLDETISFVKAYYRRPIAHGDELQPSGGGRVTELLARPLLNTLFPELAGFLQPLSGEYAGRRDVLSSVPFFSGYGVEVGLLIDLLETAGLDTLAQVDLDERIHRNRPLEDLSLMAYAIAHTILRRAEEWGRIKVGHDYPTVPLLVPDDDGLSIRPTNQVERPPISSLAMPAAAALP